MSRVACFGSGYSSDMFHPSRKPQKGVINTPKVTYQRVNGLYKHADDVESCQPASMPPPLIKRTHPKAAPIELVIRMLELYPSGAKNNPHIKK